LASLEFITDIYSNSPSICGRNVHISPVTTFVLLYTSMARSHLDYCSSVWAPYKKEIQRL